MLCYETTRLQQMLYRGEKVNMDEGQKRGLEEYPAFVGDMFGRMYSGDRVQRKEPSEDLRPYEMMHDAASEVPEWGGLVERTRGNHFLAVASASIIAEEMAKALPADSAVPSVRKRESVRDMLEGMLEGLDEGSAGTEELGREVEAAEGALKVAIQQVESTAASMAMEGEAARMRIAIKGAVEKASREAEQVAGGYSALGGDPLVNDAKKQAGMRALAVAMKKAPALAQILELAGRLQRIMASVKSEEVGKDPAEVVGVTTGADLGRLLPSEMCKLAMSPKMFFSDMMEGRLLQYQSRTQVEKGRGPLVVCIDHSGSMQAGSRHVWASAIAVALLKEAMDEGRPFAVCLFNGEIQDSWTFSHTGDMAGLLSLVCRTPDGGTDTSLALGWACVQVKQQPKADVVILTDGVDGSLENRVGRVQEWKQALGVKILTVRIGGDGGGYYPALNQISDRLWEVSEFADVVKDLLREVVKK